ncbi:MAG: hypothetical protein KC464_14835 [Myxococcales bacterium]|nr:hypothetical protein [Myxococcales bacterium]
MRHRSTISALFLATTVVTTLAACGGPGSDAVTAAEAEAPCRTGCAHQDACNPDGTESVDACVADCVDTFAGWMREDALTELADCAAATACDASDDACLLACEPTSAHVAYEARCRAVLGGCLDATELAVRCEVTPMPSPADAGFLCYVAPAIIEEMTACFGDGAACTDAAACLDEIVGRHGIAF